MTVIKAIQRWWAGWRDRPPLEMPEPFKHPLLGILTYEEEGWWSGKYQTGSGEELELTITGDLTEPAGIEARALASTLERYPSLKKEVLSFLRARLVDPKVRHDEFSITGIDHLWEDGGTHFFVDLIHADDPHAIWRVEYVEGAPRHVICDR